MRVFIGMGSNLGDRQRALEEALVGLGSLDGTELLGVSSIYETDALGAPGEPPYLNAVCQVETSLDPLAVLEALQRLERIAGRPSRGRGGARTLDLDLLSYGECCIRRCGLEVPHPRLACRPFVLVPLKEVAPGWRHPATGLTVDDLLAPFAGQAGVRWFVAPALPAPVS